ncbi:MAG TPA: bacteriohemerythrin [Chitinispirillaceae bacterium]|nr:bacteriohemerythrin [Chitinispirillaceae bacterium]
MAFMEWNDSMSVGVQQIDNEHKKLVDLVNTLNDSMKNGKSKEALQIVFSELVDYTIEHFSNEELLMQKVNYSNITVHKREHDELTKKVRVLKDDFISGKMMVSIEVRDFLKNWIVNHIQKTDKLYTKAMNDNAIK